MSKLGQKEYKRKHDWVGRQIHWEICVANGIHVKSKWYEHQTEALQTDHFVTAGRPDMILIDKKHHK